MSLLPHYFWFVVVASCIAFPVAIYRDMRTFASVDPAQFTRQTIRLAFFICLQSVFFFLPVIAGSFFERTYYPGSANLLIYTMLGIPSGAVGFLIIRQITGVLGIGLSVRELKWSAIGILSVYSFFTVYFYGPEMGYYFTAPLLLFLVGIKVVNRIGIVLLGFAGMVPLVSLEGFEQVSLAVSLWGIEHPIFIALTTVCMLSLPFVLHFAAACIRE